VTSRLTFLFAASLLVSPAAWPQADSIPESVKTKNAQEPDATLSRHDELEGALIEAKRIFEIAEKQRLPTDTKRIAYALNYGDILRRSGKLKESQRVLTLTLSRGVDAYGAKSEEIVPVLFSLADANAGLGNLKAQRKHLRRAAGIVRKIYGRKSLEYADAALMVGAAIVENSNVVRRIGAPMFGRAGILEVDPRDPSFTPKTSTITTSSFGKAYLRTARKLFVANIGDNRAKIGRAEYYLGRIAIDDHRHTDAVELFESALDTLPETIKGVSSQYETLVKDMECLEFLDPQSISSDTHDKLAIFKDEIQQDLPQVPPSDLYYPIKRPPPDYPMAAADNGQNGYVDVMYTVNELGTPTDLRILYSCNRRLFDAAALQAVRRFEYSVPLVNGVPVAVPNVKTRIAFRMYR